MRRLLIISLILVFSSSASDNSDKRIKINNKTGSATITDQLAKSETISYLLGARANQLMKINLSSDEGMHFSIKDLRTGLFLDGATEFDGARTWEGVLPTTGDYRITVSSEGVSGNFTMNISLK